MAHSLRIILKHYCESKDATYCVYLKDFLKSEESTRKYINELPLYSTQISDVLSNSPEQIANNPVSIKDLDRLIHTYIKLLPFTERPNAMKEFNALFKKTHTTCGYLLYNLRTFKDGKPVGGKFYCRPEDLLDGVEIEILLLKRLQKGELELMMNPDGDIDYERVSNTQVRLAKEFCMSHTAIKNHIQKIKHAHNLLGYDLSIKLKDKPIEYGGTTIHPVFLALNPSEAVLLTAWLKKRIPKEEGRLGEMAAVLADDIFRQLSKHGKQIVLEKAKDLNITFDESCNPRESIPHHRVENYKDDISICLKKSVHCKIKLWQTGEKELEGYLSSRDGYTYELRDKNDYPILAEANGAPKRLKEEDIIFFNAI